MVGLMESSFMAVYLPFYFLIFGGRAFAGKDGTDLGNVSSIFPFSRREMSAHLGVLTHLPWVGLSLINRVKLIV